MNCTRHCTAHGSPLRRVAVDAWGVVVLTLGGFAAQCHAESTQQQGLAAGAALSASAHIDIRVIVLPTLALSTQAAGWRIQGNSGALTLQRSAAGAADGQAPGASLQVSPRRRTTDTTVSLGAAGSELVTVASP